MNLHLEELGHARAAAENQQRLGPRLAMSAQRVRREKAALSSGSKPRPPKRPDFSAPANGALPPLKGAIWYPCAKPPGEVKVGPNVLTVAEDCPIAGGKLPLVVISHGRGGDFLGHHDTAEALADAGFVSVAINHPGDTASDMSRTDDPSIFVERPADIKRTIDFILGGWSDSARIDPSCIGFFGFSRGGYTGLVDIGAELSLGKALRLCEGNDSPICDQVRKGTPPELVHDPRIRPP